MRQNNDITEGKAPRAVNKWDTPERLKNIHSDYQLNANLTIVTSITPQTLTKRRTLGVDGKIITDTVAHIIKGKAINITVKNPHQLAEILDGLEQSQAVTWGIHIGEQAETTLLSKKLYDQQHETQGMLTRSNEHFKWGNDGGVMMLDCDDNNLTKEQFIKSISDIINLENTAYIWRPSSSSYIYNGNEQINGLKGQRLYIFVKNAHDIERAGKVLFNRLWLNSHGYYDISKAGSFLERSPIDSSVWQPSRLDFAAGSHCVLPLEHRTVPTEHKNGDSLDTQAILLDLTEKEQAELANIKASYKANLADESDKKKANFSHSKALENLDKQGIKNPSTDQLEDAKLNVLRALNIGVLTGDFIIHLADGKQVSIGEILADPNQYHGMETKDPLEPEYNNGRTVGKLYLNGQSPNLHSFAHGGRNYKLMRQPRRIEHKDGKTYETTEKTLELMKSLPDYYDMGDQMVSIKDRQVVPFSNDSLEHELGGIAQYWKSAITTQQAECEKLIDPPPKVIKHIMAMQKGRGLKPLNAVITTPTITYNDHVVNKQGYDAKTCLYLDSLEHNVMIPKRVSINDAKAAYRELMKPFGTFDFSDNLSRSVALSAILTAVTRAALPTAPAFAFDAPKQGSGKTYFCECLGLLAMGNTPAMTPSIEKNEEEIRKLLLSMLLQGHRFIVWDNIMGTFSSATMASFLTSESFSGRILGRTQHVETPNRAMLLLTGNNITLVGDMPRRVLTCRFDTGLENPTKAKRNLSAIDGLKPSIYIRKYRHKLTVAAITIVRGYLQSDVYLNGGAKSDKLPSFEHWDTVARQPVAWLAQYLQELTDPKQTIDESMGKDPEQETLSEMLAGIYEWRQNRVFTAKELYDYVAPNYSTNTQLCEALNELNGGQRLSSRSIGRLISYRRGRIADGLKLEQVKNSSKGSSYKIVKA